MLDELGISLDYLHAGAGHKAALHLDQIDTSHADRFDRIVFLHRDPRDTVVSGFYQADRRTGGYSGTISDFIRDPHHGIEKVLRYNALWLALARERPGILPVTYEELQRDGVGTLTEVAGFLGHGFAPDVIAWVVHNNSFGRMQERERSRSYTAAYGNRLRPGDPEDPNSFKVRRGKVGGYRDELSAEDIAYCDQVMAHPTGAAI